MQQNLNNSTVVGLRMIMRVEPNATKKPLSVVALLSAVIFAILVMPKNSVASDCCPFCSAASQTLRQEIMSMDAVAIGRLETDGRTDVDGTAAFRIEKVLSGEKLIKLDQQIDASYFGPGKSAKKFLLLAVDPTKLLWSSPLPISADAEKYIEAIRKLPESQVERLEFFQKYFEHSDSLLARDSYDEFALAPYSDVVLLKDKMNREQLLKWVQDTSKSPDRKRLYFTMLAICGKPEDAVLFESMIRSENAEARAGLDALIAAYLTLKGEEGVELVKKEFFDNEKSQYADIYSAVMALRFHGTEANVLPKTAITGAMHRLLERPDLADLVIPDLARWGDWSQVDKVSELFEKATDDNNWVRVPVINYLRACPLPEAKEKLIKLEKIDPAAVKRAKTFFPIPSPAAPKKEDATSSIQSNSVHRALATLQNRTSVRVASLDKAFVVSQLKHKAYADSAGIFGSSLESRPANREVNLWAPLAVVAIATIMLAIVMWNIATSGGVVAPRFGLISLPLK